VRPGAAAAPKRQRQRTEPNPFGAWVSARLRSMRMSQRQLAMRSGVHHSTISRLINGGRTPSIRTAIRVARILDPKGLNPFVQKPADQPIRVEHALRSDPALRPGDVRELMRDYLRVRSDGIEDDARGTTPGRRG